VSNYPKRKGFLDPIKTKCWRTNPYHLLAVAYCPYLQLPFGSGNHYLNSQNHKYSHLASFPYTGYVLILASQARRYLQVLHLLSTAQRPAADFVMLFRPVRAIHECYVGYPKVIW